ncbi:MAG: hypothetical protein EBZ74_05570 [Planctomycetia bacterium]|nr:hypothetical protein [Planctomycetia bacterium]
MKRFPVVSMFLVLVVGLVMADSASAAGGLRRGRSSCDCATEPACAAAEPACCAAEPACAAAEPACCAAEPACCAAEPACCDAAPRRRGRLRGWLSSRKASHSADSCTSCCEEPACSAEPCCNAG